MFDKDKYINDFTAILLLRDLADSTVENYVSYLKRFLNYLCAHLNGKDPAAVSWEELRAYILFLKNVENLQNRSINPMIAQLRDFWRYTLRKDWDKYMVPYLKIDEYLPAVPTKAEMESIIANTWNPMYACIFAAMYSAGLRVSEAVRLCYEDVSRSKNNIHVAKSKNRAERKAILSTKFVDLLTDYWKKRGKPSPHGYLFPGRSEDGHIGEQSVRNVMTKVLVELGLQDKGYTPHSCRHCFGLELYNSGADLLAIRDAMGHKSISSTVLYTSLGIGSSHGLTSPYDMEG